MAPNHTTTQPWLASEMPKESFGDFAAHAWAQAIIASPATTEVAHQSRTIFRNSTYHSLFNRTLATNDTIRASQAFVRRRGPGESGESEGESAGVEALMLASLGSGLDGHPGLAHGGVVSTLFDESLSLAVLQVVRGSFVTAQTTVVYKRPLKTPCCLLLRSEVTKREGRKAWVSASLEDGEGGVFATAEGLFIISRESKA